MAPAFSTEQNERTDILHGSLADQLFGTVFENTGLIQVEIPDGRNVQGKR
jgi:hypothetical protein